MNDEKEFPFILEEDQTDIWCNCTRHIFKFQGCEAWIVEPGKDELRGKYFSSNLPEEKKVRKWFWVPQWPTAFPERNGVNELLALGYYMVHVNIHDTFGNAAGMKRIRDFYDFLRSMDFAEKGAFIGMSYGGLYTMRILAEFPEIGSCAYLDAPVCNLNFLEFTNGDRTGTAEAYGLDCVDDLKDHPLSPINNYMPLVKAKIPLYLLLPLCDRTVEPETNGALLAERYAAAGGPITLVNRPAWGHHPHGMDNPLELVKFILKYTWNV
ncbi:MAG: alpha/beta hydrolase [Lentisphaeria bacterium]|nr:alpha/beta hydrolase [Lentisphaeria bacterium]